eukprot:403352727
MSDLPLQQLSTTATEMSEVNHCSNKHPETLDNAGPDSTSKTTSDSGKEMFAFKNKHPIEKRQKWAVQALEQYQHKFPLIIEKAAGNNKMPELANPKFLMPQVFKVSEVQTIVRKKLNLNREQSLFLLANGKHLLKQDQKLSEIYHKYKDQDGFLYLQYAMENTYG